MIKIEIELNCDKYTGLRIRDLIDSLLEKNVDGLLLKSAKTFFKGEMD